MRSLLGINHGFASKKSPFQRMQHQPESQKHEKHPSRASEVVERAVMERLQQTFREEIDCGDDAVESGHPELEPLPFLHEPDHQHRRENQCGGDKLPVMNDRIPDEVSHGIGESKPEPDNQIAAAEKWCRFLLHGWQLTATTRPEQLPPAIVILAGGREDRG